MGIGGGIGSLNVWLMGMLALGRGLIWRVVHDARRVRWLWAHGGDAIKEGSRCGEESVDGVVARGVLLDVLAGCVEVFTAQDDTCKLMSRVLVAGRAVTICWCLHVRDNGASLPWRTGGRFGAQSGAGGMSNQEQAVLADVVSQSREASSLIGDERAGREEEEG